MTDKKPEELSENELGAVTGGIGGSVKDEAKQRMGIVIEDKPAPTKSFTTSKTTLRSKGLKDGFITSHQVGGSGK